MKGIRRSVWLLALPLCLALPRSGFTTDPPVWPPPDCDPDGDGILEWGCFLQALCNGDPFGQPIDPRALQDQDGRALVFLYHSEAHAVVPPPGGPPEDLDGTLLFTVYGGPDNARIEPPPPMDYVTEGQIVHFDPGAVCAGPDPCEGYPGGEDDFDLGFAIEHGDYFYVYMLVNDAGSEPPSGRDPFAAFDVGMSKAVLLDAGPVPYPAANENGYGITTAGDLDIVPDDPGEDLESVGFVAAGVYGFEGGFRDPLRDAADDDPDPDWGSFHSRMIVVTSPFGPQFAYFNGRNREGLGANFYAVTPATFPQIECEITRVGPQPEPGGTTRVRVRLENLDRVLDPPDEAIGGTHPITIAVGLQEKIDPQPEGEPPPDPCVEEISFVETNSCSGDASPFDGTVTLGPAEVWACLSEDSPPSCVTVDFDVTLRPGCSRAVQLEALLDVAPPYDDSELDGCADHGDGCMFTKAGGLFEVVPDAACDASLNLVWLELDKSVERVCIEPGPWEPPEPLPGDPAQVPRCGIARYTVTVRNPSDETMSEVFVCDLLPPELEFLRLLPNPDVVLCDEGEGPCDPEEICFKILPDLPPGGEVTFQYEAKVRFWAGEDHLYANSATAHGRYGPEPEDVATSDPASASINVPVLQLTGEGVAADPPSVPPCTSASSLLRYRITNTGEWALEGFHCDPCPDPAFDLTVVSPCPDYLEPGAVAEIVVKAVPHEGAPPGEHTIQLCAVGYPDCQDPQERDPDSDPSCEAPGSPPPSDCRVEVCAGVPLEVQAAGLQLAVGAALDTPACCDAVFQCTLTNTGELPIEGLTLLGCADENGCFDGDCRIDPPLPLTLGPGDPPFLFTLTVRLRPGAAPGATCHLSAQVGGNVAGWPECAVSAQAAGPVRVAVTCLHADFAPPPPPPAASLCQEFDVVARLTNCGEVDLDRIHLDWGAMTEGCFEAPAGYPPDPSLDFTLTPGDSLEVPLTLRVLPGCPSGPEASIAFRGTALPTCAADSVGEECRTASNAGEQPIDILEPRVTLILDPPDPPAPALGDTVTFCMDVENSGEVDLDYVKLTLTLDEGLQVDPASVPDCCTLLGDGRTLSCEFDLAGDPLEPGKRLSERLQCLLCLDAVVMATSETLCARGEVTAHPAPADPDDHACDPFDAGEACIFVVPIPMLSTAGLLLLVGAMLGLLVVHGRRRGL